MLKRLGSELVVVESETEAEYVTQVDFARPYIFPECLPCCELSSFVKYPLLRLALSKMSASTKLPPGGHPLRCFR